MSRPETPPPFKAPLVDDPDNDPLWKWYWAESAGGHTLTFGKYKDKNLKLYNASFRYVDFARENCNKWARREFIAACDIYREGLEASVEEHYGRFIVPFGRKHRGKMIEECRDKQWMLWTQGQKRLTDRHPIYFEAVQQWLDHPHQHMAIHDVGQLCDPREYEQDMAGYRMAGRSYVLADVEEETESDREFIASSQEGTEAESEASFEYSSADAESGSQESGSQETSGSEETGSAETESEETGQETDEVVQRTKRKAHATPTPTSTPTSSQESGGFRVNRPSRKAKRLRISSSGSSSSDEGTVMPVVPSSDNIAEE
ncbi:hypothetical protein HWV62_38410 [Athelia sp. TMB]|nr:hypothetical protein HWV62_38410 [Athelia sp. TMB]